MGEYQSVKSAVGRSGRLPNGELLDHAACMDALIDVKSKEYEAQYIAHIGDKNDIEERLLENPGMFKTPIVRNGKKATVGYQPDIWAAWEKGE
jgi:arsenate reductase-like glutaredoxin family protein